MEIFILLKKNQNHFLNLYIIILVNYLYLKRQLFLKYYSLGKIFLNISFIHDKNIWNKNDLRPDFYLPSYNLVIEFDGIQHFEPVEHFGGEKNFQITQKRDRDKNEYCKKNNINILRIPYWEFDNIENIICQEIEKLKTFND